MIKSEVKGKLVFPDGFATQGDLVDIAERLFVPVMVNGIQSRKAIDGPPLPSLAPATIKRKGHDRPLIETGKLHRAFMVRRKGKTQVHITLVGDRHEIGKYLQIDGVRSKTGLKFFKFFGINESMEAAAINVMKSRIKKAVDKFNGRKG